MSGYKVKRALIMAAGIGKRMRPLTLRTPKPLIEVCGVRMIDTIIDALLENGIDDIVIVTGYMSESFEVLRTKYPAIRFVNNPDYDTCNNISSLYYARDFLDTDVVITDADQIVRNKDILSPDFELSGYNATEVASHTDEWVMNLDDGVVTSCSRNGGDKGWQLYSVSRWSREDALKLKQFVASEFESGNRDVYWDDIPMFVHADEFRLGIRVMAKDDLLEIDSIDELKTIDPSYSNI